MTETEKRLFKEAVINEYKLKHKEPKKIFSNEFLKKLKVLAPLEIVVGIGAAALLVYLNGFRALVNLLLMGVIWLTLISTLVSVFVKTK